ncbi:hypothetical protein DB346_08155 [Verrucomicrobia bacterium LW23]|nr:hypothetical protein DB346_08155 [Verrucomicrobia bacterium LW23]
MALKNDGAINYGSMPLTIAAVTYIAQNVKVNRPTFKIESRDHLNRPDGKVTDDDFVTGTATLKLGQNRVPKNGDEFLETFDSELGNEVFYITNVGQSFEQAGIRMVEVAFDKKYNT